MRGRVAMVNVQLRPHIGYLQYVSLAAPGDGGARAALAALDGREWRSGPALVAEANGCLRAALPLDGAEPFADPFRRTAEIVALLRLRATQLNGDQPGSRRGVLSRFHLSAA